MILVSDERGGNVMSGHSKWSSIKHKKAAIDNKRGKLWGKLSKAIIIAAKGGGDPAMNLKLRYAIDAAKAVSMPKDNISRAIKKGTGELGGGSFDEILYEGYGPGGVAVLCEVLTDNRNVMVLLSDGKENETRFWDRNIDCGAGSDEGDSMRDRIMGTDTQVTAIAFGPEVNQDQMQEIADKTDGDYTYVDLNIGRNAAGSADALANSLADGYMFALQRARRPVGVGESRRTGTGYDEPHCQRP